MLGGILLAFLVTAAVCIYIRRSLDRGSIRNIETRDETATDMLQTNEGEDNEYDYMFDRTDNWDYFIMVGSLSLSGFLTLIHLATNYILLLLEWDHKRSVQHQQ